MPLLLTRCSLFLATALALACPSPKPLTVIVPDTQDTAALEDTGPFDADGDGWNQRVDCDDTNSEVFPGTEEVCNGIDDNCNGQIDEHLLSTWFADGDGDGYGDPDSEESFCERPPGYVGQSGDCNDDDPDIHPDAEDICDLVDNDCDGVPDSDAVDSDGDGLCNTLDSTVYSNNFDENTWDGWSTVELGYGGNAEWSMSGGTLNEQSDIGNALALGPDLGVMENYTVSIDVYFGPSFNNGTGIAFAFVDERNFWMARWIDPNDVYGYYPLGGRVEFYACVAASCEVITADDGSQPLWVPEEVWVELKLQVQGDTMSISLEGKEVLTHTEPDASPIGAHHFGLWSYDNDGGVFFNNLVITNP